MAITPVFLPEKFHIEMSLVGYIPMGHKESDVTEQARKHQHSIFKPNSPRPHCLGHEETWPNKNTDQIPYDIRPKLTPLKKKKLKKKRNMTTVSLKDWISFAESSQKKKDSRSAAASMPLTSICRLKKHCNPNSLEHTQKKLGRPFFFKQGPQQSSFKCQRNIPEPSYSN